MSTVIRVRDLVKEYRRYRRPSDRLREVLPFLTPRYESFMALEDIDFEVASGETVGLVGKNGAGKSTLLQLIANVLEPTSGSVEVHGRVGSLLELGAGFHPDFTGLENVRLQAQLGGIHPSIVEEKLPQILEFADIGDFVYQPVRNYSSGMFVRLAFSSAIHFDPEVLIIDEALAVGDVFFQHKCIERIRRFQGEGKTIFVVSHDPQTIRHLCDRALLLQNGRLVADGNPADIVARYLHDSAMSRAGETARPDPGAHDDAQTEPTAKTRRDEDAEPADELPPPLRAGLERHGIGGGTILGVSCRDEKGENVEATDNRSRVQLRVHARAEGEIPHANIGFMIRDKKGLDVSGSNLSFEGRALPHLRADDEVLAVFDIDLPELAAGTYSFVTALADGSHEGEYKIVDWVEHALILNVRAPRETYGHLRFAVEASVFTIDSSNTVPLTAPADPSATEEP